jgi:response regulator RpfG family c-di-GMP phosphodiesterase
MMGEPERKIVVVLDPDPATLGAARRTFWNEPYSLMTTERASLALEWVAEYSVSLVMAANRVPEMPGTEALAVVNRLSPETACALLTGRPGESLVLRGIRLSVVTVIRKPWVDAEIRKTVRRLLGLAEPDVQARPGSERLRA